MKLLVCILNWRTADLTVRALRHTVPQARAIGGVRVCVVDNDSQDGSFERLDSLVVREKLNDVVDVIQSGHNGGFGFGNNAAIRKALYSRDPADFVYLLNSDACPKPGAIETLLDFMEHHPEAGIAGSLVQQTSGEPETSAFRFPSIWSEIERGARLGLVSRGLRTRTVHMPQPPSGTYVDWVAGASMMLRRTMLEHIGLFDERFFLYYEETDLCLRAVRAGFAVAYVSDASVTHVGGASTGVQHRTRVMQPMPRYVFESRRHYFLKNHGRRGLWSANAAYLLFGATLRVRCALRWKEDPERPGEWRSAAFFNVTHP